MPTIVTNNAQCSLNISVIGDVMIDKYYMGSADRVSPEAPVPIIKINSEFCRPGGAANVAANIRSLDAQASLHSIIGDDNQGEFLRSCPELTDVDTTNLLASLRMRTIVKNRVFCAGHQISRFDQEDLHEDPNALYSLQQNAIANIENSHAAVISDYAKGTCTPSLCQEIITIAARKKIPCIVDPKPRNAAMYRGASLITPNRMEAEELAGGKIRTINDAISAARRIRRDINVGSVAITLGEMGIAGVDREEAFECPAVKRNVADVTGAGDTVVAVLAVTLSTGISLHEACSIANIAGSVQVSRIGTSLVSWDDLRTVQSHGKLLRTFSDAACIANEARNVGKKVGFTNGCFDILHVGHLALLEAAASACDVLIVGVNSDRSVRAIKGPSRPFSPCSERMRILASLQGISAVIEFDTETPLELIHAIRPDILIKGGDYANKAIAGADFVSSYGGKVLTSNYINGRSTTLLAEKLLDTLGPQD